jgi:hypothetical protein
MLEFSDINYQINTRFFGRIVSHYDGLSVRCLAYFEATDKLPHINGNCTQMDSDGDQIYDRLNYPDLERKLLRVMCTVRPKFMEVSLQWIS